jgi:DNA mismatch repair protein MutS
MASLVVQVHETEHDVLFLHRIVPGAADKSYGIQVARRAGIPVTVLDRAKALLGELEEARRRAPASPPGATIQAPRIIQSSLFADADDPLLDEIRAIDPQALTPDRAQELVTRSRPR